MSATRPDFQSPTTRNKIRHLRDLIDLAERTGTSTLGPTIAAAADALAESLQSDWTSYLAAEAAGPGAATVVFTFGDETAREEIYAAVEALAKRLGCTAEVHDEDMLERGEAASWYVDEHGGMS